MDNIKKNHHYIPRFYVKQFSDNEKSVGMYLNRFQKDIPDASIVKIFYSDYLYGKNNALEDALMNVEGHWSRLIYSINKSNILPSSKLAHQQLIYFMLVSKYRTLITANTNKNLIDKLQEIGFLKSNTTKQTLLQVPNAIPLKVALESYSIVEDLELLLIHNSTSLGFITSDNPICLYNPFYALKQHKGGNHLYNVGIMIFMPISPKNCLVLYDKDTYIMKDINNNSILLEDRSYIQQMNIMLADNSYNCLIYNNRQNSYIIDLIPFINPNKVLPVYDQGFLSPIYPTGVYELSFFELNENMLDIILPDTREGIKRPSAQKALYSNISAFFDKLSEHGHGWL